MPARKQDLIDITFKVLQEIRGTASGVDYNYLLALMLCFSDEGMMDNNCRYVPDPSNKYCYFHSEIWNALEPVWERFLSNVGIEKASALLDVIRKQKLTPGEKVSLLDSYTVGPAKNEAFYAQSSSLTKLAINLLNYQGGTIYNPFAGSASYGVSLKAGDKYFGEEFSKEAWALGAIKLLLAKSPSHNFIIGDSFNRIGFSDDDFCKEKFNYVISTPPFGMRVPENRSMVAEDILLSKAEQLLAPLGTMVMFSMATITTKGGRLRDIRQRLTEHNCIDTVIALPKDAFAPMTSVPTVALILKTDRDNLPVRFVDARDCYGNKVLKVSEILKRLEDPNCIREISIEQIREHDYSWHPAKYEDTFIGGPEKGYERIRLRDILIQTGKSTPVYGKRHYLSVSELSTDPFNYRKGVESVEEKENVDSRSAEAAAKLREESLISIASLEKQKKDLQISISEIEGELRAQEEVQRESQEAKLEQMAIEANSLDKEKQAVLAELDEVTALYHRELAESQNGNGINHSYLSSLSQRQDLLQKKIDDFEERKMLQEETYEKEVMMERQLSDIKIKARQDSLANNLHHLREIDEQIVTIQKRLDSSIREIEDQAARELVQVVHPALFLGGRKPKIKFSYISNVSNDTPVFLTNNTVSAFKVDTARVDLDYLVFILSRTEFKDLGEPIPMIHAPEILDQSIDILSDIEQQKAYVAEQRAASNPFFKEWDEERRGYIAQIEKERKKHKESEDKLLAALGSKQHDLGNLCPKITLKFADLFDIIEELPDSTVEKQTLINQIALINAEMIDMNQIISFLSEREDFPAATRVDIIQFFNQYIESHIGNGYYIEPLHYDKTELDALGDSIYVNASDLALTRAVLNIRENAEMHGFNPDTREIKHFFSVSVRADYDSDTCIIDFSNNGLPMPGGMDEKRYGTKGEKAGETAHTGNGGWYISEMAKYYGGSFNVNPKDADPDLVTIRLTLPLSHE